MKDVDRCEENRWYKQRILKLVNKMDNTKFLRAIYIYKRIGRGIKYLLRYKKTYDDSTENSAQYRTVAIMAAVFSL